MQIVHERCCGLDVHTKSVVACILITCEDGTVQREVRTYATMTADLLMLRDWLEPWEVAMESTGVFWHPIYTILEDEQRTITLVNAQHMKAVPGRKTDVKDSEWLADLLRHGLRHPLASFPQPLFGNCVNEPASARRWSRSGLLRSMASKRSWSQPTSNSQRWRPTCLAKVDAICSRPS